jgi:hypothetical protein
MASWRFFFLEVSSADQIEHLAEILFGVTIARNEITAGWSNITIRKFPRIEVANKNFVTTTRTGIMLESTPARKETRDAAERTVVTVNLRQHQRRQLLRGNEREWFLERGFTFCSRTSCHRQRGLSEFIYKIDQKVVS